MTNRNLLRRLTEKKIEFRRPPRSGEDVAKLGETLRKAYGARVVHAGLDLLVRRAGPVGASGSQQHKR